MTCKLDIIIVGAGISGLASAIQCALSGHSVIVLEAAKELVEVGAGIQLTPNATRLLKTWSVYDSICTKVCEPTSMILYNYEGKTLVCEKNFDVRIRHRFGAPFFSCHRADLQQALVKRAKELGVRVVLGAKIIQMHFSSALGDRARVQSAMGQCYEADVVVGADGLWSTCRSALLGRNDAPLPTGDLAYRMVLQTDQIEESELREMVQTPGCRFWAGPDAHAVAYSLRGGKLYNLVLLVPDDLDEGVARTQGNLEEMKSLVQGWDPRLTRLLEYVDKVDKWKLMHRPEIRSWVNPQNNLVLIGDSCHPMLPYLAQGANSAMEDGAVLGQLLAPEYFTSKAKLPEALRVFQQLRKSRGEAIARETFEQRHYLHLHNGPEQAKRDAIMISQLGKELRSPFPNRFLCPQVQSWLFGYDAAQEVKKAMQTCYKLTVRKPISNQSFYEVEKRKMEKRRVTMAINDLRVKGVCHHNEFATSGVLRS